MGNTMGTPHAIKRRQRTYERSVSDRVRSGVARSTLSRSLGRGTCSRRERRALDLIRPERLDLDALQELPGNTSPTETLQKVQRRVDCEIPRAGEPFFRR